MRKISTLLLIMILLSCNKDYQCEIYYIDGGKDTVTIDGIPSIQSRYGLSYLMCGGTPKTPNVTRFKILKVIEKNNTNRRRNSSVPYYGRN